MRLLSECGSQNGQASSPFGTNVLFCLVSLGFLPRETTVWGTGMVSALALMWDQSKDWMLCQDTSEPHPPVLKERPTSGQWSRVQMGAGFKGTSVMCSQHKTWHSSAYVFLWICSPTEIGSVSAELSLELIAEAPLNHQHWDILPAVSGQMEVPLSPALPVCNVYFWDQFTSSCLIFLFYQMELLMFIHF